MDILPHPQVHLSVSIVLHRSSMELLQRALLSLQKAALVAQKTGCLHRVSVYLVDNTSEDEYQEQLARLLAGWTKSEFFNLQYSVQPCNRGFGHGHNTVLEMLASDDIVLLSPKVFGRDGEQEFLCKRYPSVLLLFLRGFAPRFVRRLFRQRLAAYEMIDLCSGEGQVNVAIASGCFMLAPTTVLRAVGGFNEVLYKLRDHVFKPSRLELDIAGQKNS